MTLIKLLLSCTALFFFFAGILGDNYSFQQVGAFPVVVVGPKKTTLPPLSSSSSSLSCICIHCKWVTSCKAYHFVETKHEQPHMTDTPTFEPRNGSPTIHVNIRSVPTEESKQELERLQKEHAMETKRAQEKAASQQQDHNNENENGDEQPPLLYGEERYQAQPITTMEYDVVKCEDYVEDIGAWVRNMPEEIRLANPDFVPT